MNISNIKHMAKARLHTTKIGRTLCRLAGEESGQTAMEYVVIATLICAAIAVGVWLFGSQILGMFVAAGDATEGRHDEAEKKVVGMRELKDENERVAKEADNQWTTKKDAQDVGGGVR